MCNIGVLGILFTPFSEWLYKPLITEDSPRPGDTIIILTGVDLFDTAEGFLDLSTFARLHKGLELYKKGFAKRIICVGGQRLSSSGKSFAEVMKNTLILYDVPEKNIYLQDKIPGNWNYYQNILNLTEQFQIDLNRSLIVTSPQNTFRIKKIFDSMGVSPCMIASTKYMLKPSNWHQRFEFFRDVANEYWAITLFYFLGRI